MSVLGEKCKKKEKKKKNSMTQHQTSDVWILNVPKKTNLHYWGLLMMSYLL